MVELYLLLLIVLASFALTRHRVYVLCGFYVVYGALKVMTSTDAASWSELLLFRALYPILLISAFWRLLRDRTFLDKIGSWPLVSYSLIIILLAGAALHSPSNHIFIANDPANIWSLLAIVSLFYLSASQLQGPHDLHVFAAATAAVSLVLSFWIIRSTANLNFEAFRGGVEVNQNFVSMYVLAGAIPLVYAFFFVRMKIARVAVFAMLLCVIFAALLLASRGIIVAFVASLLAMTARWIRRHSLRGAFALGLVMVGLFGAAMLLPGGSNFLARFQDSDVSTLNSRALVWKYSLRCFGESGILTMLAGRGYNSAPEILAPVFSDDLWSYHNDFLERLMDQGIVGLAAFLVFLWMIFRRIREAHHPLQDLMLGWLVFVAVSGLSGVFAGQHIFWLLLGSITGACAAYKVGLKPKEVMSSDK